MSEQDTGGWYYGIGGWDGEPDCTVAARYVSRREAEKDLLINYEEVRGPFTSRKEANQDADAWLEKASADDN